MKRVAIVLAALTLFTGGVGTGYAAAPSKRRPVPVHRQNLRELLRSCVATRDPQSKACKRLFAVLK